MPAPPLDADYWRTYRQLNAQRKAYQAHLIRREWRQKLFDLLGGAKCKDCGNDDFRVLEFDHLTDKTANVASFLGKNWDKAVAEAKKCEVVCANCHLIRTSDRRPVPEPSGTKWLRRSKEVCPQGHPKTPENRYRWRNKTYCRPCSNETKRRRRAG